MPLRLGRRGSLAAVFRPSLLIVLVCAATFTSAVESGQQESSSSWLDRTLEELGNDSNDAALEGADRIISRGRRVIPIADAPYSERLARLGGRNRLGGIRRLRLSSSSLRRSQAKPSPTLWTRDNAASVSSTQLTRAKLYSSKSSSGQPILHLPRSTSAPEITPHVTPSLRGGFRRGLLYGIRRSPANVDMIAHRTIDPKTRQSDKLSKPTIKPHRVTVTDNPIRSRSRSRGQSKPSRRVDNGDNGGQFIRARVPINENRRRLIAEEPSLETRTTNAPPRAIYHFRNATVPHRPPTKLTSIPKLRIRRPDFGPLARGNKAAESQPIPLPTTNSVAGVSNAPSFGTFGNGGGLADLSSSGAVAPVATQPPQPPPPSPLSSPPRASGFGSFGRNAGPSEEIESADSGLLPNERPVQPPPPPDPETAGALFGAHPPLPGADHELLPPPEQPPRPEAGAQRFTLNESSAAANEASSAPSEDSSAGSGLLPGPSSGPPGGPEIGAAFGSDSGLQPGLVKQQPLDSPPVAIETTRAAEPSTSAPTAAPTSAPPPPPPTRPPPPPPPPEHVIPEESGLRPVRPPSEAAGPGGFGSGSAGPGGFGGGGFGGGGGLGNDLGGESQFTGQSALTPNRIGPTGDGFNPPLIAGVAPPPPVAGVNFGGGAAGIPFVLPLPDTTINPPSTLKPSALLSALNKVDTGFNQALNAFEEGSPVERAAIDILEVALGSEKLESQLKLLGHVDRTVGLDNLKRLQRWANTGGALDLLQQQVVKIASNYKPDDLPDIPALNYLLSYSGKRK